MDNDSSVLFLISIAEIQTAPYIPREFFLIEPSTTPMSSCLSVVFAIRSSRNSSKPSPLIMLEAKLMAETLHNEIKSKATLSY